MTNIAKLETKWDKLTDKKKASLAFGGFLATLICLACGMYWHFIFGDDFLIYYGSGSDSIGQTIPFILNEASRLYSGDISQWNQYQFLGATTIQFLNPDYLPAIFGEDAVPTMMLVSQLLKIVLAGIFFYLFLGYFNLCYKTRFIAGLGIAFCGRMIELAPWTAYTIEITLFCAMLWGFERFYSNRRHIFVFPVAFALMGMAEGVYGFVLYGAIAVFYALFRTIYGRKSSGNHKNTIIFFAQFIGLLIAGVLISLPVTLPSLESYSTSARVGSNLTGSGFSFLGLLLPSSATLCAEEILKFFSNAITGHMGSFTGSTNILDAPYFYAGLIPLLGLPFAFKNKDKNQRIALGLILFFAIFYCYSEGFRYILNGFSVSGTDFRQSSFWVVVVFLLIGSIGLDELWRAKNPKPIIIYGLILLLVFTSTAFSIWTEISKPYFLLTASLLLVYAAAFALSKITKSRNFALAFLTLIVILAPIEYFAQDYKAINNATHLSSSEYEAQLGTDPEDAVLAASGLSEDTYRIDYKTMMLTRSMAETYLGTEAYIGGAGTTQSLTDFLKTLNNDYVRQLGYSRYSYGYFDNATNALLGVKYLVYPNDGIPYYTPYGYTEINRTETYIVLENTKALPLIYGYSKNNTAGQEAFLADDRTISSETMLSSAIVPSDQSIEGKLDDNEATAASENHTTALAKSTSTATKESPVTIEEIPNRNASWLEISMDLSATATTSGSVNVNVTLYDSDGNVTNVVPYYTAAGNEHICVQVNDDRATSALVAIPATNACDDARITGISIAACDGSYFDEYDKKIDGHMKDSPQVYSYSSGKLTGSVDMKSDGFLATSIPWSQNWDLYIDGEKVETFTINIGFVGSQITAGKHNIELVYNNSMQYVGLFASIATLIMLLAIPFLCNKAKFGKQRQVAHR